MNEGYPLTDFTLEELSLLADSITRHLVIERKRFTDFESFDLENSYLDDRIKMSLTIERLLEINVRVLTAFSIVKEREKVTNS